MISSCSTTISILRRGFNAQPPPLFASRHCAKFGAPETLLAFHLWLQGRLYESGLVEVFRKA